MTALVTCTTAQRTVPAAAAHLHLQCDEGRGVSALKSLDIGVIIAIRFARTASAASAAVLANSNSTSPADLCV